MRLIDLDEEVGELRVQTFSPGIPQSPDPQYRTEWPSQFTIPIDWESRFDVILEPEPWEPWIPEPPNTTLITVHPTGTDDVSEGGWTGQNQRPATVGAVPQKGGDLKILR